MFETLTIYFAKKPVPCFAVIITLLPLTLIFVRKAYLDPSFKLLVFYLLLKFAIDIFMVHSAALQKNNIIYYNLSIPLYYCLISGMFYYKLSGTYSRKIVVYSMLVFSSFCIWEIFNANSNIRDLYNHRAVLYSKTIEGVLINSWILLYFYELIKSLRIPNLLNFPFFWVCSGLLLYYSSFIFIAPALHYTATWSGSLDLGVTRIIPYIFEILSAIMFSVGIYHFSAADYAKQ
ncbi:hypothetical protein SAMN05660293_03537 [Dyadobacter psychrophilus]|uniref:Uncharacterized protein n=1 Tax=Dyadobacter psychrophilus TaxID=651661 RepID=A0A1T5FWX6_9BACT|nr:hypothetical protein SAMN05660293_03537 [Dyadobacter psychrophilus]